MLQKEIKLQVKLYVEPDGNEYYAYCPELDGVHIDGKTEEDAVNNCLIAIEAYLLTLLAHGDPIPLGCMDDKKIHAIMQHKPAPQPHIRELSIATA